MTGKDPSQPEVLVRVASELEASAIIAALENAGIKAEAVGGFTAAFQASVPGDVQVLVRRDEWETAQAVLAELQQHGPDDLGPSDEDESS